jgi:hypothetical protein
VYVTLYIHHETLPPPAPTETGKDFNPMTTTAVENDQELTLLSIPSNHNIHNNLTGQNICFLVTLFIQCVVLQTKLSISARLQWSWAAHIFCSRWRTVEWASKRIATLLRVCSGQNAQWEIFCFYFNVNIL